MRRFLDLVAHVVPHQLAARLDHFSNHKKFYQPFRGPMNGATARLETVRALLEHCGIERIIETGTYRGSTTEWFGTFGIPVVSMEIVPRYAEFSRIRVKKMPHVEIQTVSSVEGLERFIAAGEGLDAPTLFYLDAHWYDYLPLRREYELIMANFKRPLIVIDDFQVPDDAGYHFAQYDEVGRLTLDYLIKPSDAHKPAVFFPRTASRWETGFRSGYVIVSPDAEFNAYMSHSTLLRQGKAQAVKAVA